MLGSVMSGYLLLGQLRQVGQFMSC